MSGSGGLGSLFGGGGLGSLLGGALGGLGSLFGAKIQSNAASDANKVQLAMYARTRQDLEAYRQLGQKGMNRLTASIGDLTRPFQPTMEQLAQTPGYQFTLNQGLEATQNAFAAQGLASSGAAMKGAEQYASGLASTTYQQQLQDYLAQNMQKYNMLMGMTQIGAGAAAGTAQAGQAAGAQVGANMIGAGNAWASGLSGFGNALSGGINNAMGWNYANTMMNRMYPVA